MNLLLVKGVAVSYCYPKFNKDIKRKIVGFSLGYSSKFCLNFEIDRSFIPFKIFLSKISQAWAFSSSVPVCYFVLLRRGKRENNFLCYSFYCLIHFDFRQIGFQKNLSEQLYYISKVSLGFALDARWSKFPIFSVWYFSRARLSWSPNSQSQFA